ncbi:hypothetical protein [Streptomyces lavendulae]|uniref:hypothetical protein n=1 Tax=Streptomyces lavendulae TaxID=1914 RepID=UPI0024A1BC75|nr:hypothetical protein [Streptomyces lavendulae]GLX22166.1 hypothetical protein Slala01_58100 [Streptomyces lavendulae subsp. lavendulae]GLX29874.1 hypothetical protein Slala02_56940 [Streptomyces lavendulae subsp. lavendulae]
MNDPSTLAATDHGDREGLPATPDPTDGPATPAPPAPDAAFAPPAPDAAPDPPSAGPAPAGPDPAPRPDPYPAPHPEPVRTLLETAATCRPVEEVTALVSLLKESGGLDSPGHDALRAAAVARPVDDVRHMVALLGEHPLEEAEADITLRAAAVGRPIEDVALLASILGPDGTPRTDRPPARTALPPPPQDPPPAAAAPEPVRAPAAPVPAAVAAPAPPEDDEWPAEADRAPTTPGRAAAAPDRVPPAAPATGALGHVLRWPTAAALLLCGVLHLPGNLARPPAPQTLAALAVSLLCLALGALLAVRDSPPVWRAAAVAALAVVTLHVVGGLVLFDPLDGALGGPYEWSGVTAVLCAGTGAVLAGLALAYRRPPADTGG